MSFTSKYFRLKPFVFISTLVFGLSLFFNQEVLAEPISKKRVEAIMAQLKLQNSFIRNTTARTVECSSGKPVSIRVPLGRVTVISFPVKPKEILPGAGAFDFKQVKNDLAIKALKYPAATNMFTYLEARRCSFVIEAIASRGDDLVIVQDAKNDLLDVNFK
jgi:hypothetical protein